ncbi:RidA family protein [Zavarzinia aquatilis]|uniref:RidA family protein n=1 Tax=Zavarzinia aquatilis TaxID=2211142 RepID=A0A317E067_9PROT|nr:RidA family protein [Zavarzinia aquatilis]PWR19500.1 hypothetical protein DKG74_17065 [Zavarzinia aquatilis]
MTASSEFPAAIRVGDIVYVGGRNAGDPVAGIESQTATAFERLVATLAAAGASMGDLVNLRTYYVYDGEGGRDVTDYWERMTEVRIRYIADPGPAATALRVRGVPARADLLGVDGIAATGADRQRIMPEHAWDWSIPVTLSQGWRIGDRIYVGGQISADRKGKAIALGDIRGQTRNALEYIRHVLADGGMDWRDVVHMRICFQHRGQQAAARRLLAEIMAEVRETLPEPRPALNAFGVDLLYEGLVLEIDAVARKGGKTPLYPAGSGDWIAIDGFPAACRAGDELYVGGLSAPGGASLQAQVEATCDRLAACLAAGGFEAEDLVKLTLFIVADADEARAAEDRRTVTALVRQYLPGPGPVVTLLTLTGLPHDGQRFQLDGVAVRGGDRLHIED